MTIKDIARLAGVSTSTVSKIMNHKDAAISSITRERVLNIIKEYHYTPYSASSRQHRSKTLLLGILLRSSKSPFLNELTKQAQAQGYTVLVCESANNLETELKRLSALLQHNVDGLLWEPVNAKSLQWEKHIVDSHTPFLLFNAPFADSAFNFDIAKASYLATETLIQNKHLHIACLLREDFSKKAFLEGYKACLLEHQIPYNASNVYTSIQTSLLQKITSQQISGIINFAFHDALELYESLQLLHISMPHEFSLITLQDAELVNIPFPRITSVAFSYSQYAAELCTHLISSIEKTTKPKKNNFLGSFSLQAGDTLGIPHKLNPQKFLVIGSINFDSYMSVKELPTTGNAAITSSFYSSPGGKGINQAIGIAKLGCQVSLIGTVGNDIESENILSTLNNYSIDHSGISRTRDSITGKGYIFLDHSGDSIIVILAGANQALSPSLIEKQESLFQNTSYCLIQTEIPIQSVLTSAKLARKYHAKTILKPSACAHLGDDLLAHINILIPNQNEIDVLCPALASLEEKADYFLNKGVEIVIVTLGSEGCYLKTKTESQYFAACDFHSIDNTGAADAFISALAVYLQKGYEIQKAIQIASYAAGFSISRMGILPSLIDANALESYVQQV